MPAKYIAEVYALHCVLENPANWHASAESLRRMQRHLTFFSITGRKVPRLTATMRRQMYEKKKTYVLGRVMTETKAGHVNVASVCRDAPRPNRLTAMCRSGIQFQPEAQLRFNELTTFR